MKSFAQTLLLLVAFCFPALSQQDIVVQPDNGNRGQRLQVLFSGVNIDFNQATGIQLFFTQGTNVVIYPEVFHVQASDIATGTYEIPIDADCGSYALESNYSYYFPNKFTVDCSAQIAGNVFFDTNGNGTRDGIESGTEGVTVVVQPTAGNPIVALTDVNGNYSALVSLGAYSVSIQLPQYHQQTSATISYNVNLTSLNNTSGGNDFGIAYDGNHNDLEVSLASTMPIAGFSTNYWVNCSNAGTTSQTASVSLSLDSNLTFSFASVPPSSSSGNLLTWNSLILQPGESVNIMIDATVAVVFPNTPVTITAQITSAATDETPDNNADTLTENVLSSYDPNDKLVEPAGVAAEKWTLKDQYLTYTIRFQNTGNYYAFNVHLTDVLDQNLDFTTLQVISSSHEVEYLLKANELNFYFNNIMLPDSNMDLSGSNGYVQYRIKPKPGLADNTVIENTADIFFDFNPAVTTNTTENKLVDVIPTGIWSPGLSADGFVKVYPNPAEGNQSLTIEISNQIPFSAINNLSIYTQEGKKIYEVNSVKGYRITVDALSDYHGLAIIRMQCSDKIYYSKAVKF